jgi:hypothetical protein
MDTSGIVLSPLRRGRFVIFFAALVLFFGITPYAQAVNLPETGQTICYAA